MIDVVVIGGYLGAGKTTLLNHLLREGTGRSTLVLVNDFGTVAVADELVAARDGEMLTLTNGCVCCSLASPLIDTLVGIRERADAPELLIVEASGVADPEPLSHHAMIPGFRLSGIVVVADAETIEARAGHELVGRTVIRQLRSAGLMVLNKTDLVGPAAIERLHDWLRTVAPSAVVVDAEHGAVPVAMVVGPQPEVPRPHGYHDGHAHHHDVHRTVTWSPVGLVDRAALVGVFEDERTGIVRAKGVVRFADRPERREMVQVAGRRWHCSPVDGDGDDALVLIGLPPAFDEATLLDRLAAMVNARE